MAKFQIFRDSANQYRFRLKADNHETIATSEGYTTKWSAQQGIEAVRKAAPSAPTQDLT